MGSDRTADSTGDDRPAAERNVGDAEQHVLGAAQWRPVAGSPGAIRALADGLSPLQLLAATEGLRAHPAGVAGPLDAEGHIDWDLWCVDGTMVRASRSAAGAGKNGALRNLPTTRWVARAADSGASSTWSLTAAAFPSPSQSRRARSTSARSSKR